jgi:SAM-dependent methyltransferase
MANHSPEINRDNELQCLLCGGGLEVIRENLLGSTTKGDKLHSFTLCKCSACGHVQKRIDSHYQRAMHDLYNSDYAAACGQRINIVNGKVVSRYLTLAQNLARILSLEKINGRILDIGSGGGDLLAAFSTELPNWERAAYDVSDSSAAVVSAKGATEFFYGDLGKIQKQFDLIVFNHVAEHLTNPLEVFRQAKRILRKNGHIVVIVPSFELVHPDLFIYEHCSHFTTRSLHFLASMAGLDVVNTMQNAVGKTEIGFIAKDSDNGIMNSVESALAWSESLPKTISMISHERKIGVFGLSGAGLWLGVLLKDKLAFFVDDDPSKQGKMFAQCPIISVESINPNDVVFVPFNNPDASIEMCQSLRSRRPDVRFYAAE